MKKVYLILIDEHDGIEEAVFEEDILVSWRGIDITKTTSTFYRVSEESMLKVWEVCGYRVELKVSDTCFNDLSSIR